MNFEFFLITSFAFIVSDFTEFKIETQWVEELHGTEFPDPWTLDKTNHPSREAGFIQMSKEAITSTKASEYTGKGKHREIEGKFDHARLSTKIFVYFRVVCGEGEVAFGVLF